MSLDEFIQNLQHLLKKFPQAIVEHPDRYSITTKATLYSDGNAYLRYDWTKDQEEARRNQAIYSFQNQLVNQR